MLREKMAIALAHFFRLVAHPLVDNPLVNAPHTADQVIADEWSRPYSRQTAADPGKRGMTEKYWPPVARVDNVFGDRNLVCTCPPVSDYAEAG